MEKKLKINTFGGIKIPLFRTGKEYAALSINPEPFDKLRGVSEAEPQIPGSCPERIVVNEVALSRRINYLRLSLTDHCNLNCVYCTPLEKSGFLAHEQVLRYEEIKRLVTVFVRAGIRKVRLTGGEPLLKKDVIFLIRMLRSIEGLEELSMTTNGTLLNDYAGFLKEAGLDRINISLDTLKKGRFKTITGKDCFAQVWQGIMAALKAGLAPVKLNVVLMRGINDDEIEDFARLALEYPVNVRFIEFFHTNFRAKKLFHVLVSSAEVKKIIENSLGRLNPVNDFLGNGPAEYYSLKGAQGALGFISATTGNFCGSCNRVRVDCAGKISPCLFSGPALDSRLFLRASFNDDKLLDEIQRVFVLKPIYNKGKIFERKVEMSSIGG